MSIFRSIWGSALEKLRNATRIVVIGYSFPPTDFYAEWLFRNAMEDKDETKVWVVNPDNTHKDFRKRMGEIFRYGYDSSYKTYGEIRNLLKNMYANPPRKRA